MGTTMTSDELKNYITHFYDEEGVPIIAQINLRNEILRSFYERLLEDLEVTLDAIQILEEKEGGTIPWEVVKAELDEQWSKELAE